MTQQDYDIVAEGKKVINAPYQKYFEQAKAASEAGKLKLVSEHILEPYNGHGFKIDKGQVVRYELMGGAQTIDLFYMVRSRPTEEWADTFHTACFGSHTQWEVDHLYSNAPWGLYGERACHSYVLHNGACSAAIYEAAFGTVNPNNCHFNIAQGMLDIAGEEVARRFIHPACFMHFQIVAFDKVPTALTYFSGGPVFKDGDFVELLAHEDLYAAISPCPLGDQTDMTGIENCTCWPLRIAIYEGEDGPLETAPDPGRKSMNAVDFVLAGKPGMVVGKVGKKA